MPRVPKQSKSKKYERPYLQTLKRQGLQTLAKKEGIKANVKSEEIIVQLLLKNEPFDIAINEEENTPPPEATNQAVNQATAIEVDVEGTSQSKTTNQATAMNVDIESTAQPETTNQVTSQETGIDVDGESTSQPEYITVKDEEEIDSVSQVDRVPGVSRQDSEHASTRTRISNRYRIPTPFPRRQSIPEDPYIDVHTKKEIRKVRRTWAKLTKMQDTMKQDINEYLAILDNVETEMNEAAKGTKEMHWNRRTIENVVTQMKYNRHVYDGTGHMPKAQQAAYQRFVAENWEPKRAAAEQELQERVLRHDAGIWSDDDSTADEMDSEGGDSDREEFDPVAGLARFMAADAEAKAAQALVGTDL